jgi:hypothetical protein
MPKNDHPTLKKPNGSVTRRKFLKRSAQAGALLAAPTLIPSSALGLGGATPPSERIVVGGVGVGPRGRYVLDFFLKENDVQFVAICDLKKEAREQVKDIVDKHYGNSDCKMYRDLREFHAERTDIDAVLTATGDRWHALSAILAMRAGKDVYSEKPSAMTIQEGQAVVDTAERFGRVYQTGVQRLSEPHFVFANELLRTGRLGPIKTVRAHIAPWVGVIMRHDWLPEEPLPPQEEVDWDIWLGPCPWRPYNHEYVKGGWRGHYDYHTSDIGEWGAHTIAQCQVAIGAEATCPIEYHPVDHPSADGMTCTYANGIELSLHLDKEKKIWHGSCGVRYEGADGWVSIADGYEKPEVSSPAMLDEYDKLVDEYIEQTGRPVRGRDDKHGFAMRHVRDFLDCVKTRRQTVAHPTMMHRSMSAVHAANIAMWLGREMRYDPVKQEFLNDDEANRMRSRAQREPWIV